MWRRELCVRLDDAVFSLPYPCVVTLNRGRICCDVSVIFYGFLFGPIGCNLQTRDTYVYRQVIYTGPSSRVQSLEYLTGISSKQTSTGPPTP